MSTQTRGNSSASVHIGDSRLLYDQMAVIRGNPQFWDMLNDYSTTHEVSALEVGGGIGCLSGLVAGISGATVYSTDLSSYDGRLARRDFECVLARNTEAIGQHLYVSRLDIINAAKQVQFVTCSALELPFEDQTFDFAFSLNAFEHISDPAQALSEIRRVLKPGGRVFIQFSPIFTADDGSHLYSQQLLSVPWCVLLHSHEGIMNQVTKSGCDSERARAVLHSLNGLPAEYYRHMFAKADFNILFLSEFSGTVLPGSLQSAEFVEAQKLFSAKDLCVLGFKGLLRKPPNRQ